MIGLFRKPPISSGLSLALGHHYNAHELRVMDRFGTTVQIEAGATLATEGASGREVLVIVEGTAAVSRGGELLATVGPGDVVGELAVLLHQRRNATVMATSPLRAIVFTGQEFHSVLDQCPRFAEQVNALTEQRVVGHHA